MLFAQGTRDALADLALLQDVMTGLGERATSALLDEADHTFHVPARSGRKDPDVLAALLDRVVAWMREPQGPQVR